jgi:polyphosphate kinase 2 (PPK2 family)
MLEQLDLTRALSKDEYRARMTPLKFEMYQIGRAVFESKTPVLIVFEGVGTAGMGRAITALVTRLDPRGYRVHPISAPSERELRYPWLHRFWLRAPARGEIAIFHGSWYRRVLIDRVAKNIAKHAWRDDASSRKLRKLRRVRDDTAEAYRDIQDFERTLADDGVVIQKFWLHIDNQEQKRRIKKLLNTKTTAWRVSQEARLGADRYDEFILAAEEMFGYTQAEYAPWTLVSASNRRWMTVQVFETLIARLKPFVAAQLLEISPDDLAMQQALEQELEDAGEYRPHPNAG